MAIAGWAAPLSPETAIVCENHERYCIVRRPAHCGENELSDGKTFDILSSESVAHTFFYFVFDLLLLPLPALSV